MSYLKVGDVQVAQGDLAAALQSYGDTLAIAERLAQSDPGNAGWQRDLSVSYDSIGDVQDAQGNLAAALKSYRDGLAISSAWRNPIPATRSGSAIYRYRTTRSATCRLTQGDLVGAHEIHIATALAITSVWRNPIPTTPFGSAICWCRITGSAMCWLRRATLSLR